MKHKFKLFVLSAALTATTVFGVFAQTQNSAIPAPVSVSGTNEDAEKERIEKIVREYILKNPSIIREATLALQAQEEKEKYERAALNLKKYNREIFADAATPVAGNARADVKVAVFFDYNCGYCRKSLPALVEILAKDPAVQIVYKELPILGEASLLAAKAALAANLQGKYNEFHNALLASNETNPASIRIIAAKIGLNYAKLRLDMESKVVMEELARTYQLATALDINGTPAYIVGNTLLPGAVDAEGLKRVIADERAKALSADNKN